MRVVNGEKFYSPREIAEQGFITNSKGKPDYHFVHRLIRRGELPFVVFNEKSMIPYKYVSESAIKAYNAKFTWKESRKGK